MAQVFPTKSNLMSTKKSLDLAKLGYDLLDRKRNILVHEMMQLIDKASKIQQEIDETYSKAYLALQRANVTLGMCAEFAQAIPVDESLDIDLRSVMGVELPVVTLGDEKLDMYYGLNSTNSQLDEAYLSFVQVKRMTAELAEIENSVYRLADAIKKTQKRANALDNIMIPQFTATIKYITEALEEKRTRGFLAPESHQETEGRKRVVKSNQPSRLGGLLHLCCFIFYSNSSDNLLPRSLHQCRASLSKTARGGRTSRLRSFLYRH